MRSFVSTVCVLAAAGVCGTVVTTGCGPRSDPEASRAAAERRAKQRAAAQTDALLSSIASQLATLPEAVQTDLRPPMVVVDSRRSTDGEDIEAVILRPEGVPLNAPANLLRVPRRNARFRSVEVESGDTVKYFAMLGRETRERMRDAGDADIVVMEAVEYEVAQVLSDNELLIVGGLTREVDIPFRIEIWRNIDDRMQEIGDQLATYAQYRRPPLGWQPSPDEAELRQLHERVNQWLRQSGGVGADRAAEAKQWLATLPSEILEQERVRQQLDPKQIAAGPFVPYDSRLLQEAVWARDVARRARGDSPAVRWQSEQLFDWVVRNVVLVDDAPPSDPWETLLHGRGEAEDRAWAFVRLCRAIRIDAVVLPVQTDAGSTPLVAVLADDGVALFDARLGLPLGKTPGAPVADASLADFVADDALLREYDLPDSPYPVTAEALAAATPSVVAAPLALSGRAAALERALTGVDSVVLTADPASLADSVAAALPEAPMVTLWAYPYETLLAKLAAPRSVRNDEVRAFLPFAWRPPLWKGRVLSFRGLVETKTQQADDLAEPQNDLRAAQQSLMDRSLRPRDDRLAEVASLAKREIYLRAKTIATYWLGVVALERGDHQNALDWFSNRTLASPIVGWLKSGVAYGSARAYETLGEVDRAASLLESSDSPQRHGDRLRARWLRTLPKDDEDQPEADAADAAP
ncbi:MAG: hypothetical protein AAFV43_08890 [Planctomycetota bacterium]